MVADEKVKLVKNVKFGFMQVKPTPTAEEISEYYAKEFYSNEYKSLNDSSLEVQLEDRDFLEGSWSDMAHNLSGILNRTLSGLSVLDVGCGWAQTLLFLREKGMDCYGFDPAPEAINYGLGKGLNLVVAGMDRVDVFNGKKFDVVMLNNVLEHLGDPEKIIEEIRQTILAPGGIVVIDVPNEFNDFQMAGRDLHHLDDWWVAAPQHLNYFSRRTLENLLNGCGLKVELGEASFPLEMFLLFGDNYVGDGAVGKECHQKRVSFERNLRDLGYGHKLSEFYQALAKIGLGRQIRIYARAK